MIRRVAAFLNYTAIPDKLRVVGEWGTATCHAALTHRLTSLPRPTCLPEYITMWFGTKKL
ncbi:hypothetical protein DSLASN_10220 [Desulfoluna limicola]|uniref:Uncharacterized protein n=1 Tax=Desulfoluna limicola TaxID=2810562 RepID=A0ABM7PCT7_9BACT|nr:hypothetical protein DSLASN_10220 [Desulfoluna limicola]